MPASTVTQFTLSFETEIWHTVIKSQGTYSVSNLGRVRRDRRGPNTYEGKILVAFPSSKGYASVDIRQNGIRKTRPIHQLVGESFIGPCPEGMEWNHKNGNKMDARVDNLEFLTHSENTLHAYRVLGVPGLCGSTNPSAKLSESQIFQIRHLYKQGLSKLLLAEKFSVSKHTIHSIIYRRRWTHI